MHRCRPFPCDASTITVTRNLFARADVSSLDYSIAFLLFVARIKFVGELMNAFDLPQRRTDGDRICGRRR
jgi:hypothetical protein